MIDISQITLFGETYNFRDNVLSGEISTIVADALSTGKYTAGLNVNDDGDYLIIDSSTPLLADAFIFDNYATKDYVDNNINNIFK